MKKHGQKFFALAILLAILIPLSSADAQSNSLLFQDDFSSDKGWIDESNGYIYRDTENEWLIWQVRRSEQRRYYIPINAKSNSLQLNFRFNVTSAGGNGDVYIGFVENLDSPTDWPIDATGTFVGLWDDTRYRTKVGLIAMYGDGSSQIIGPNVSTINYGSLNVWRKASLNIDQGNWTLTVSTDDGTQLGQMSGALTGSHSKYQYLMIFRDNIGGWEWENGLLDDISVYGELDKPENNPPEVNVDHIGIVVDEGQVAFNSGTVIDHEGDPFTLSSSTGSVVDNGDGTWSWSFETSDGPDESQTVEIVAKDDKDASASVSFELGVNNVAPSVAIGEDETIILGETYLGSGSFSDPGNDTWVATVIYGDDPENQTLLLSGKYFRLEHFYTNTGTYNLEVNVSDDDGGFSSDTISIHVLSNSENVETIINRVEKINFKNKGIRNSLIKKLIGIKAKIERKNEKSAVNALHAFINEVNALIKSKRISQEDGQMLLNPAYELIWALTTHEQGLRELAKDRGRTIGSAVRLEPLKNDFLYRKLLAHEFNSITPENAMKMDALIPNLSLDKCEDIINIDFSKPGIIDFSRADEIVKFAFENNMQIRGHTLIWGQQLPTWLKECDWSRDQVEYILKEYIKAVIEHYKETYPGTVVAWDVVNEAIDYNGNFKYNFWMKNLGYEYVGMAFQAAREADPNVLLFYNDYSCDSLPLIPCGNWTGLKKNLSILVMTDSLKRKGIIDGVGMQMHVDPNLYEPLSLKLFMNAITERDLLVHITEMDVRIAFVTSHRYAVQANVYRSVMKECLNSNNCNNFTMWGFTDKHSWWEELYKALGINFLFEAPLIFDTDYDPKPAYFALKDELKK